MTLRQFVRLFTHLQYLPVLENGEETTLVGGQAVMEGVMMRSPQSYCVAVRRPNGEIVTEEGPLERVTDRHPILKLPVLRGLATLGHAMWLGMRALRFSAGCALESVGDGAGTKLEAPVRQTVKQPGSKAMAIQVMFSLLFMIGLYKFVPLYLATTLGHHFQAIGGRVAINLVDGGLRIAIFLGFMVLLSRTKDMRRVFEYHGAEHKVVFNFESGQPVNVENAQRFVTWHPRCGTSFLFVVLIVAMLAYAFLPIDNFWLKLAARVVLLPVVVGVSYEAIRYSAKRQGSLLALLTRPGLWLQRITTQQPSDSQAEVAIHALDRAMALEEARGGTLVIA